MTALLLAYLPRPAVGQTESDNGFERMEAGVEDAAYLSIVLPLAAGLNLTDASPNLNQSPPGLDLRARRALVWDNVGAAQTTSDVLMLTLMASALFMPLIGEASVDEASLNGAIVGLEALLTTSFLTTVAKHVAGRLRPAYFGDPDALNDGPVIAAFDHPADESFRYNSFFSGHTSIAFASATLLTVYAYEYEWLDNDVRWVIPTTAYLTALTTGYMRVAGDRHWLTDVLVGAFVGTGTAYLVFAVRAD